MQKAAAFCSQEGSQHTPHTRTSNARDLADRVDNPHEDSQARTPCLCSDDAACRMKVPAVAVAPRAPPLRLPPPPARQQVADGEAPL